MAITRINIDEFSLNLEEIYIQDTVGQLIDKVNRNFREIQSGGGGPMGPRGRQGRPSCRGRQGNIGSGGTGGSDDFLNRISISGCEDYSYHFEEFSAKLDFNSVIFNKYANKTFLLTNLSISNTGVQLREIDEEDLSYEKVTLALYDYKLKIYNSDNDGNGKHIHLLNSKAAEDDDKYLCNSGFTISNDFTPFTSLETLKIIGQKNSDIPFHSHHVEITSDFTDLRKTVLGQVLRFDTGTSTDALNYKTGTFELQTQSKDNIFRIPDRQGYVAIWEDTNEDDENWEVIEQADLTFNRVHFKYYDTDVYKVYGDSDVPFIYHDQSFVRFKRLNNWVLIDYHLGVIVTENPEDIELMTLQTKVNIPTIGCRTIGWYPSTIMESETLSDDFLQFFGFFKIDSTTIGTDKTFIISQKLPGNYLHLEYSDVNNIFWFTGQVWATVEEADEVCEVVEVTQDELCVTDIVVEPDDFGETACPYNCYQEYTVASPGSTIDITLDIIGHPYKEDEMIVKYLHTDLTIQVLERDTEYTYTDGITISIDSAEIDPTPTDGDIVAICYSGIISTVGNETIDDDDIIVFRNYENHTLIDIANYISRTIFGSAGYPCTSGTSGINGSSGSSGRDGDFVIGAPGSSGTSGSSGQDGSSGTSGATGSSGETGSSGSSGVDGNFLGSSGTSGETGSSGTSGETGSSGTAGSSGEDGDFVIGAPGSSGTSGEAGSSGTSVAGSSGTSGLAGSSGTSQAGSSGTSGEAGSSGTSTAGSSGTSGTCGACSSGTSGDNGTSGSSGISPLPIPGSSGTSGTCSCSSGTSGTDGHVA